MVLVTFNGPPTEQRTSAGPVRDALTAWASRVVRSALLCDPRCRWSAHLGPGGPRTSQKYTPPPPPLCQCAGPGGAVVSKGPTDTAGQRRIKGTPIVPTNSALEGEGTVGGDSRGSAGATGAQRGHCNPTRLPAPPLRLPAPRMRESPPATFSLDSSDGVQWPRPPFWHSPHDRHCGRHLRCLTDSRTGTRGMNRTFTGRWRTAQTTSALWRMLGVGTGGRAFPQGRHAAPNPTPKAADGG